MSLYIQSRFHSKENLNGRNYQNTRKMFNFMAQAPTEGLAIFTRMAYYHKNSLVTRPWFHKNGLIAKNNQFSFE